jgi:hypothetical protein
MRRGETGLVDGGGETGSRTVLLEHARGAKATIGLAVGT